MNDESHETVYNRKYAYKIRGYAPVPAKVVSSPDISGGYIWTNVWLGQMYPRDRFGLTYESAKHKIPQSEKLSQYQKVRNYLFYLFYLAYMCTSKSSVYGVSRTCPGDMFGRGDMFGLLHSERTWE